MPDEIDEIEWLRKHDEKLLGGARDQILQLMTEHEHSHHGGGYCISERINVVAFIAHSLGLRADANDTWEYIRAILVTFYESHLH